MLPFPPLVIVLVLLRASLVPVQAPVEAPAPDPLASHVAAAEAAAEQGASKLGLRAADAAQLLLAMAYNESRYDSRALSRLEQRSDGTYHRVTGVWSRATPPAGAEPPWFCGPIQTGGRVPWDVCQRMRTDLTFAYATAMAELAGWYRDPACRGREQDARLACALHGYGGGYRMIQRGTHSYPRRVLGRAAGLGACVRRGPSLVACIQMAGRRVGGV